ncbi:hypothetical protein DNTS_016609 [Danionella cerebrum]|uniref:ABM domain-containing protein n=1 Tax=Danionella cerebrum TaxID=2873325 RepID=A0A553R5G8_9TELE|nr:hypothetical protein DNTS_016609 [Danionella translucida]
MLACAEMITMCLQSAKREHLRSKHQQNPEQDAVHGLSIFHDIFRRADKNARTFLPFCSAAICFLQIRADAHLFSIVSSYYQAITVDSCREGPSRRGQEKEPFLLRGLLWIVPEEQEHSHTLRSSSLMTSDAVNVAYDGKLSFEEFKAYFADGILTTDELRELFYSIDGRQTNVSAEFRRHLNLGTDKLSDYFSEHLGGYLEVLSALEKLNVSVLKAMDKTKEEYQGSSVLGQFVTRFMLRETWSQLVSLQVSLQSAMEAVEEQSSTKPFPRFQQLYNRHTGSPSQTIKILIPESLQHISDVSFVKFTNRPVISVLDGCPTLDPFSASHCGRWRSVRIDVKAPDHLVLQKTNRRCGRRVQKNMCLSPTDPYSGILTTGVTVDTDEHWCSQINRLQQLIDKLECQSPKLEPLREDSLASTYNSNILLVQRQMSVMENDLEEFQKTLKSYADTTADQNDNLHVSIQKLPEKSCYIIYEFWQDRISWMSYMQSDASKMFQRCIIEMLEDPEIVSTMLMPVNIFLFVPRSFLVDHDKQLAADQALHCLQLEKNPAKL